VINLAFRSAFPQACLPFSADPSYLSFLIKILRILKPVGKPGVQAYKEGEQYLIKSTRKDEPEVGQPTQGLKTSFTLFQILF